MQHTKMFRIADIHQAVVASPTVGVNFTFDRDMASYHLAPGTSAPFTTNTTRTKVRFIEFDHSFERGLFISFLSYAFTQFQENGVDVSDTDMGQFGGVRGGKIEGKIARISSEYSL